MASNNSLIIDLRRQLHWHQRVLSDTFTALLWGVWFYLWRPIAGLIGWLHNWSVMFRPTSTKFLYTGTLSLEGLVSVAGAAGLLMLWSLLPKRKVSVQPTAHTLQASASYFGLSQESIEQGQAARICVVHHDAYGRIERIETRQ
ncbi:MAG: poly-beta-1,6-N-acetyl-D-glucosamine biosynthesis protein PgaD [Paraperlucidibaca sp.]